MKDTGPLVRVLYSFRCADCGKEESTRFPFNPMRETPGVLQAVPHGWSLSLFGGALQTPIALCGCRDNPPREVLN